MAYGLTILKVEDFAKWKAGFDEGAAARKAAGEKAYQVFQADGDPNAPVVLVEWDSLDNGRKFMESEDLREAMQRAGVVGQPETFFLESVDKGSV